MQLTPFLVSLSSIFCFCFLLRFNGRTFIGTYQVTCNTVHPFTYRGSSYAAVPLYFFETVMHPESKLSFLQYHHRMVTDQKARFIWNSSISFSKSDTMRNKRKAWKPQVFEKEKNKSETSNKLSLSSIHEHNTLPANLFLHETSKIVQTAIRKRVKSSTRGMAESASQEEVEILTREGIKTNTQNWVKSITRKKLKNAVPHELENASGEGFEYAPRKGVLMDGSKVEDLEETIVIPIVDLPRTQFTGKVSFGTPPQSFYLIFDTGSTNIQVVGEDCVTPTCLKVPRFSFSKSSTSQLLNPLLIHNITFGSGKVQSIFVKDRVQMGSFIVPNQTFAIIINELEERKHKNNIFREIDFQGLLGLGFPSLSTDGQASFFDKVLDQIPKEKPKQFAIYMMNHKKKTIMPHNPHRSSDMKLSSLLFLGDLCPLFYKKPLHYVKVVHEHYWETVLKEFWVGEKKLCCDVLPGYVIFDSGTSFNTLPANYYQFFFDLLDPLLVSNSVNSLKEFPTLRYVLENNVEIVLDPDMYLIQIASKGFHPAYMQLDIPHKNSNIFLLGTVAYLQHYFTVFKPSRSSKEPSLVGIAEASHTPEAYEQMVQWEQSLSI